MTIYRLERISEKDVHPDAGISNIPWEVSHGFQHDTEVLEEMSEILEGIYHYGSQSDESILDGLSPDADGSFFTRVRVRAKDGTICYRMYSRESLIKIANNILRKESINLEVEIQREHIHRTNVEISYEFNKSKPIKAIEIDGEIYPLNQVLDLRGFNSPMGRMTVVEEEFEDGEV